MSDIVKKDITVKSKALDFNDINKIINDNLDKIETYLRSDIEKLK